MTLCQVNVTFKVESDVVKSNFKRANQNYMRRFWLLIILYVVFCCAGPFLLVFLTEPSKWVYAGIALLNAIPIPFIFFVMGKYLLETDEYTRAKQARAMLTGGAVVLSFAAIWGFLELYQVLPSFWSFLHVPIFFGSYGVAYGLCSRASN